MRMIYYLFLRTHKGSTGVLKTYNDRYQGLSNNYRMTRVGATDHTEGHSARSLSRIEFFEYVYPNSNKGRTLNS